MGAEWPGAPGFTLDIEACEGGTRVSVAGELDLATAEEFSTAVREGLTTGAVLVDLGRLSFMDSAGVRALNTALREAAERGRELRVSEAMQPGVVQLLELTGMLALLPVEGAR